MEKASLPRLVDGMPQTVKNGGRGEEMSSCKPKTAPKNNNNGHNHTTEAVRVSADDKEGENILVGVHSLGRMRTSAVSILTSNFLVGFFFLAYLLVQAEDPEGEASPDGN